MKHIEEALIKQHDLSLVKDTSQTGALHSHALFRDLFINHEFFRADDKLTNMMSDLAAKEETGDTDYSIRMTVKHLTTRAIELIGIEEGKPKQPVNGAAQVDLLGTLILEALEANTGMSAAVTAVLAQSDRRNVRAQLSTILGQSVDTAFFELVQQMKSQEVLMERFKDSLYYLDLEEVNGTKGTWRALAPRRPSVDYAELTSVYIAPPIPAIKQLRQEFGLGLREAKHVVEAYISGLIE